MCDRCRDEYRTDNSELIWESWSWLLSTWETLLFECSSDRTALQCKPESKGGASCEENRLGLGFRFFKETEKGMVFDTDLPEDFAAVSAGHQKLQSVLI